MKVRILIGAEAAYACISEPHYSLDVKLHGGCSAQKSLRRSAFDLCQEATRKIELAERMERAADQLDAEAHP